MMTSPSVLLRPVPPHACSQATSARSQLSRLSAMFAAHLVGLLMMTVFTVAPAAAHPHVTVTAATTVQVDNGTITGFTHVWSFDELYSAMAVDGLDKKGDGKYTREDLAELAKVNIEGLKEFAYFTQVALAGKPLTLADPTDYWLEHKDGILALHFKLPLAQPVLIDAPNFTFAMTDPSFFIAFDLAKNNPVTLSTGAPAHCKAQVASDADAKSLNDALTQQLGGSGLGMVQTLTVVCGAK
jgi:ABC-type uncharacterized transport system substrate-binding protein